jgi:hypothetical protein
MTVLKLEIGFARQKIGAGVNAGAGAGGFALVDFGSVCPFGTDSYIIRVNIRACFRRT